jgi:hypothetical protein
MREPPQPMRRPLGSTASFPFHIATPDSNTTGGVVFEYDSLGQHQRVGISSAVGHRVAVQRLKTTPFGRATFNSALSFSYLSWSSRSWLFGGRLNFTLTAKIEPLAAVKPSTTALSPTFRSPKSWDPAAFELG